MGFFDDFTNIILAVVALVIGAVWAPNTQGKTLRQIEIERYGETIDTAADHSKAIA